MGWMRRLLLSPIHRAWLFAIRRLHPLPHNQNRGFAKLYGDVQSCTYEDVHVLWSMLQKAYPSVEDASKQSFLIC